MDNDDNDFQSRNFRLAGEDNSKFPLRPFTIPPFDLDVHLHGHLSFDNLQGDLLGIPGQDDSNWIESFSTGSSAISNAAAESCSISRRNNVWSEATSSESVEMLLKSVGEDNNVMDEKMVTEKPHNDDVLNTSSNNVDTCLANIDSVKDSIMETPMDSDSAIPLGNTNSTKNDFVGKQPSIDEKSLSVSSGNLIEDFLDDVNANANLVSSSAMCFEDHKLNEGQLISQKVQEEDTFATSPSNDHGFSDICNTSLKSVHLNEQMDIDSSVATTVKDAIMSQDAIVSSVIQREKSGVLQKCTKIDENNIKECSISVLGNFSGSEKIVDSTLLLEEFKETDYYRNSDILHNVIVDQGKIASKDVEMDNQMTNASKENLLAVADKVDTSQQSNSLKETNSTMEATKTHNVEGREVESSIMNMKNKQEAVNWEHAGDLDENVVSVGNVCSISVSNITDEKQVSEMKEPEDQFAHESKDIVMDKSVVEASKDVGNLKLDLHEKSYSENVYHLGISQINIADIQASLTVAAIVKSPESHHADITVTKSCDTNVISSDSVNPISEMAQSILVGAQIASSATTVEGSLEKKFVEDKSDFIDGIVNPTRFISLQSEDTSLTNDALVNDLVIDKQLVASSLPSPDLIRSDIDSGKDSQLPNEICEPVLDDRGNSKIILHTSLSNFEPSVTSSHGQSPSIIDMDSSLQISSQIAVIPSNEVQQSTDNHATSKHVMDENVHSIAAFEGKKSCELEKLPSEEYKNSPPSFSGDPKENVLLHVNLSENNIQDKDEGHTDQTHSISDNIVCISKSDTCQTEATSGDPKDNKSFADNKNFIFEVSQASTPSESWKPFSSPHSLENSQDQEITKSKNDKHDFVPSSTSQGDPKDNKSFADNKNFIFEVSQASIPSESWKSFSSPNSLENSQDQEITKSKNDKHDFVPSSTSQGSYLVLEEKLYDDVTKSPAIDKSHSKSIVSKRKAKEKLPTKKISEKIESPCSTSIPSSRNIQVEGARHLPYADGLKVLPSPTVQASNLPDLNSSTTTAVFSQPFTDAQQVQLRAQIFVYGSLIQSIPPDESYMISAFGGIDGERGKWLSIWRSFSEKFNRQKSPLIETPNHSVVKALDQTSRSSSLQSNVTTTPLSQNGIKGLVTPLFNSISPAMWSMSTRDILHSNTVRGSHLDHIPKISPIYPYQSPPIRQYTSNANSWATQPPCPVVPWIAPSHTSAVSTAARLPVPPITETVHITPNRDVSVSHGSTIQFMSPSAFPATGSVLNASAPSLMQIDPIKELVPGRKNPASTQKSRRRKKSLALEAIGQMSSVSESQTELNPLVGGAPSLALSPRHVNTSGKSSSGNVVSTIAPVIPPTQFQVIGSNHTEPKIIFSEETSCKIEQAKLQAEDAAAFAAASVRHSESIWNQLRIQKNSGLVSDVEQRLAFAAVAASAAVSVAKAASGAAKLAADSALYAKLMADVATTVGKTSTTSHCSENAEQFEGNDLTRVTPASIFKGKEKSDGSYSIIPAAREAARKRLEAASAANKRAEILDAVVKAAELAAEAVSQAGSIVSMGDPLPYSLSTILESGPEGIFKAQNSKTDQSIKTNVMHVEKLPVKKLSLNEDDLQDEAAVDEIVRSSAGNHIGDVSGTASQTISVGAEGEDQSSGLDENIIKHGSLVEVKTDLKGPVGVWYSARVLDITDSKAFVCYNELLNNEGSDKLKEWISFDSECNEAPRIRHPYIRLNSDVSKKRPRMASGTILYDIGDLVDVWINEGWREGIVTEKNYEATSQATKYIIHFPAGGDSSVVRSWDLRPSRVWKDGQWIEWCRQTKNNLEHHEGDTPFQKRQKISKSEAMVSREPVILGVNRKPHEFAPLPLSAKDKVFNFGKSAMDSERVKRIGLQKEGSRVVFGIPKPGKKRKFMDVGKQCVVDNTEKKREPSESVKFGKYPMPQPSTGWKNTKKIEPKSKRILESKPKVSKPLKSRNVQSRNVVDKENSSISISAASSEGNSRGTFGNSRPHPHASYVSKLEKKKNNEVSSFGNSIETTENPVSVSTSSDVEAEKVKNIHDKAILDALEPRRSIRRIQPTSRLLEGLQSSLVIPKGHNISHDKASKSSSHRTISSSRGHGHR